MTIPVLTSLGIVACGLGMWFSGALFLFVHGFGGGIKRSWPVLLIFIACFLGVLQLSGAIPDVKLEWR